MQADFAVYDRDGQLALTAEVINRLGTTRKWAAEMRYDLLAPGGYPIAPYFLLALPDRFYLWKQARRTVTERMPNYVVDAELLLRRYYEPLGYSTGELSRPAFDLVVSFWLGALTDLEIPAEGLPRHLEWLDESGLLKAVKGGRVVVEALA
jgi:hypothetical protein